MAIKQGAIISAIKPTPNIHSCIAVVLSQIVKTVSDYSQPTPELIPKNPTYPVLWYAIPKSELTPTCAKIKFKKLACFSAPHNPPSRHHKKPRLHHKLTINSPPQKHTFSHSPPQKTPQNHETQPQTLSKKKSPKQ
jgi:hypothetical protein